MAGRENIRGSKGLVDYLDDIEPSYYPGKMPSFEEFKEMLKPIPAPTKIYMSDLNWKAFDRVFREYFEERF